VSIGSVQLDLTSDGQTTISRLRGRDGRPSVDTQ
jgi:hypothetical protein